MKITINYKPLTVTVPKWAADQLSEYLKTGTVEDLELFEELVDELHVHEGWAPAFDTIVAVKGPRRHRHAAARRGTRGAR